MTLTVRLANVDQVSLKVGYLKTAARKGLKDGVIEAAGMFEAAAKELCPVLTGHLRDSIHTETLTDTAEVQTRVVTPVYPAANKYGFEPPYARRIEFGFVGTDSLGRYYNQAAQPYMRPAYDNNRDQAGAAIKDSVYSALDEAMAARSAARLRRVGVA